ncbi:hypothetical protein LCGC14_2001970 [marine sediment metagenome]|uniref:Uncharacterized protein n=1 Tax=marine sediment metagenome TaxID=412755 RepID=A0A0F9I012_9ZZZZ
MNKSWLNYFNLSDEYERKTRFLPAVLSVLPLIPVSITFSFPLLEWIGLLIGGMGLWAIMAVATSHIASLLGNHLQNKLWPDWPYDSPTNLWLHPQEESVSVQQKQRWYQAINSLVNIDIQQAVDASDQNELKATINDSVMGLRSLMWKTPEAERVRLHNIDYGYARNLTGLRPVWITLALSSFVGCWYAYFWLNAAIFWAIMSSIVLVVALILAFLLPAYVRKKAHYYAESFFGAVIAISTSQSR